MSKRQSVEMNEIFVNEAERQLEIPSLPLAESQTSVVTLETLSSTEMKIYQKEGQLEEFFGANVQSARSLTDEQPTIETSEVYPLVKTTSLHERARQLGPNFNWLKQPCSRRRPLSIPPSPIRRNPL